MNSRALAFGSLLAGDVLALVAGAQPWWRAAAAEAAVVKITGTQATGGLSQALAIVALVGTLLLLALRGNGRRVVGALLLLVGVGLVLAGGLRLKPSPGAVRSQVREVTLADSFSLGATAWPWIFAFSGVLVAVGAAVTMITAGSWPTRSDRFQPELNQALPSSSDDPAELWKAMDAGVDPTADQKEQLPADDTPDDHDTPSVADPKVRDRRAGDTMEGTEQARQLPWSPTSHIPGNVERDRRGREA
jgi:uncharacterized membrane protein (TIGR02234 family)